MVRSRGGWTRSYQVKTWNDGTARAEARGRWRRSVNKFPLKRPRARAPRGHTGRVPYRTRALGLIDMIAWGRVRSEKSQVQWTRDRACDVILVSCA